MEKTRQTQDGYEPYEKRFTGEDYLRAWKLAGGHDITQSRDGANGYAVAGSNMPQPFEERSVVKS
jgi:large subunit ribosomal protein L41